MLTHPQNGLHSNRIKRQTLSDCPLSISQLEKDARRLPASRRLWHLMTSSPSLRFRPDSYCYTVCSRPIPAPAFYLVNRSVCIASPQLVFVQLATTLPLVLLIKLGDELCGMYTSTFDEEKRDRQRDAVLCTVEELRSFIDSATWMRGSARARKALPFIVEGSCSARETELEMLLCLPPRHGGYGFPKPQMNMRVDFNREARAFAKQAYARCDLCWPDCKLDVEYDGRAWHEDEERAWHDKARANGLQQMGYRVISVSKTELDSRPLLDSAAIVLSGIVGHRLRDSMAAALEKRDILHETLLNSWRHPVFSRVCVSSDGTEDMDRFVWE